VTKPNYSHPLFGANLLTLLKLYRRSGGIKAGRKHLFFLLILAAIGRLPFSLIERLIVRFKRRKIEPIEPPIFILGHWRSGTTHLYNVMSKADKFGFVSPFSTALPWDILVIGRLFGPLLHKNLPNSRYIDNVKVDAVSPQEDEIALANMSDISYYHALYFPEKFDDFFDQGTFFDGLDLQEIERWEDTLNYLYLKLTLDQGGRRLLIKNPVYTARPAHLAQTFKGAKFVHIHRHPYKVFVSMRNFYEKLFPELALQNYEHIDIDQIIFKTYRRMMTSLKEQTKNMTDNHYAEIGFDQFQADPLGELSRIYRQLEIEDFEADKDVFAEYLDSIKDYKKNAFNMPPDLIVKIDENWGDLYADWGYAPYT